jgi:hypothetical protein
VIILFVHANPDGHDLVADWYMRDKDPKKRSLSGLPKLYQKYIGHDNNRDFYANTQAETRNMNRVMYREWLPQVVYNHHQTGPPGTVLFCPPFRDPFNYNFDPLVVSGIDAVGAAMMQRFLAEDKPGATTRSGARYSTWFNGGLRTTAYFHNMIGLLTETIGSPTPSRIPFNPDLQLPRADLLAPIAPQEWHFRQSVEYSVTGEQGGARLRVAAPRAAPPQHLADGQERDRPREQGLAGPSRRRWSPRREGRRGRTRTRSSSATRRSATPGPTSSRATNRTSSPRRSS